MGRVRLVTVPLRCAAAQSVGEAESAPELGFAVDGFEAGFAVLDAGAWGCVEVWAELGADGAEEATVDDVVAVPAPGALPGWLVPVAVTEVGAVPAEGLVASLPQAAMLMRAERVSVAGRRGLAM